MFMKSDKKKKNPAVAIGVGALALYGAYSMVCCVKNICCEKGKMLTNMFKKKQNCENSQPDCNCSEDC